MSNYPDFIKKKIEYLNSIVGTKIDSYDLIITSGKERYQSKFKSGELYKTHYDFIIKFLDGHSVSMQDLDLDTMKRTIDREISLYKEKIMKKIIEIEKEVKIGNIILEKGDRIKILEENNELPGTILRDYIKKADAERKSGGSVEINYRLPYVAVTLSDGSEYFFQGEEASDLLDEVPDNISAEDYILFLAQGW